MKCTPCFFFVFSMLLIWICILHREWGLYVNAPSSAYIQHNKGFVTQQQLGGRCVASVQVYCCFCILSDVQCFKSQHLFSQTPNVHFKTTEWLETYLSSYCSKKWPNNSPQGQSHPVSVWRWFWCELPIFSYDIGFSWIQGAVKNFQEQNQKPFLI